MPVAKISTLAQLLAEQYGARADVKMSTVTVTTTPSRILDNNPNRIGYIIINMSTGSAYINFSSTLSSTNGIILAQLGGQFGLTWRDDFDITGYEMYGIAASGSNVLTVIEEYLVDNA